jgi:acyl-coenzyme A synthetase/AMP-(fatty) acid ligase
MWERLLQPKSAPSLFMGVPTVYAKLLAHAPSPAVSSLAHLRLFVSGSAPLPVHHFERFHALTGHRILERYGMTEVGMALSNPLRPAEARTAGFVGLALC